MQQSLNLEQLQKLQEPFYRVAIKALVFDAEHRLAIVINKDGLAEIPGGGWEADETIEACITREVQEEVNGKVAQVGPVKCVVRSKSAHGWPVIRVLLTVELRDTSDLRPGEGMRAVRFLSKEEFEQQDFALTDHAIKAYAATIWNDN